MQKTYLLVQIEDNQIVGTITQDDPDAGPIYPQHGPGEGLMIAERPEGFTTVGRRPTEVAYLVDSTVVWVDEAEVTTMCSCILTQIDREADAIIADTIGNRQREYDDAYFDAKSFKDAGYSGTPPQSVTDYAEIRGWTAQQAADSVLDTGNAWLGASREIRKNRLAAKQACRDATTLDQLYAAQAAWCTFRCGMRQQLDLPAA